MIHIRLDLVLRMHFQQIERHGGTHGIRDQRLLESALARPLNLEAYQSPDVFQIAASYAAGISRNHPFLDGNKRTGFLIAALFLECNGFRFHAPEEKVVERTLALAAGAIKETAYAAWLRESCVPKETDSPRSAS